MAELARALGHEMNNTLGAMLLQIEMLGQDASLTGFARESVGILDTAAQQGIGLVRRVRDFSRLARPLVPRPVDLCKPVDAAIATMRPQLARRPAVELVVEHGQKAVVRGDEAELTLAVRELVANALGAIADVGHIRIVTAVEGGFVSCRIVDDGDGVSPEIRAQAFEPFVSTRTERGRGLGLTIALAVALRHDGDVTLVPAPRRGTVATLRVPRAR